MNNDFKLKSCSFSDMDRLFPSDLILVGYRGSIAHEMYLDPARPEGVDDKDVMGIYIAPEACYFGLDPVNPWERQVREWDCVCYELRRFVSLLEKSNPNVLSLLWLKENHYIYSNEWGKALIQHRDLFVSRKIFHSFTGYAYGQLKKMEHHIAQGYMGEKRKALVEKFGYDTKNAAHCIRLLRMGIEFLHEGVLHVEREDAPQLMEIKLGLWTLEQVKAEAAILFKRADAAYDACRLPVEPDRKKINELLVELLSFWFERSIIKYARNAATIGIGKTEARNE